MRPDHEQLGPLTNMLATGYLPKSSPPGYYAVAMHGWAYSGPVSDTELELYCTRADHPWVHAWGLARHLEQPEAPPWWHPRLLGRDDQGFMGTNRAPSALLVRFDTLQRKVAFTQAWAARQQGQDNE